MRKKHGKKNDRPAMAPGVPNSEEPSLSEPTTPRPPLPPKPDQTPPAPVSPTGQHTGIDPQLNAQGGDYLTTAQGARLHDDLHAAVRSQTVNAGLQETQGHSRVPGRGGALR